MTSVKVKYSDKRLLLTHSLLRSSDQAWISRNKLKSKLRLKSEILLKFEKNALFYAFLEKNLAQILTQLEKKLKSPLHQT